MENSGGLFAGGVEKAGETTGLWQMAFKLGRADGAGQPSAGTLKTQASLSKSIPNFNSGGCEKTGGPLPTNARRHRFSSYSNSRRCLEGSYTACCE